MLTSEVQPLPCGQTPTEPFHSSEGRKERPAEGAAEEARAAEDLGLGHLGSLIHSSSRNSIPAGGECTRKQWDFDGNSEVLFNYPVKSGE